MQCAGPIFDSSFSQRSSRGHFCLSIYLTQAERWPVRVKLEKRGKNPSQRIVLECPGHAICGLHQFAGYSARDQNIGMVMSLPKLRRGGIITLSTTGLSPRMSAMTIDVKS